MISIWRGKGGGSVEGKDFCKPHAKFCLRLSSSPILSEAEAAEAATEEATAKDFSPVNTTRMDGRAGGQRERGREKVFFLRLYTKSVTQARYAQLLKKPSDENENSVSPSRRKKKIASINTLHGREGDNGGRKEGFFIGSFPSPSARANTIVLLSTSLPFFPLRHPSIPTLPPSSSSTSFQKKSGSNRCHRREVRRVGSEGHLWRLFTTVGTPPPSSIGDWSQDLHGNWSCHWKKGKEEGGDLQSPITPRTERPAEPTGLFFYLPSSFFSFVMGRVGFKLLLQSLPSSSLGKTLSLRLHHHHSDSSRR